MSDEYINVTGQNGETYEVLPTDALLSFLQRLAADETEEQGANYYELIFTNAETASHWR
jgi:hypothetical protein